MHLRGSTGESTPGLSRWRCWPSRRCGGVLIVLFLLGTGLCADDDLSRLIRQLGSDRFRERQWAHQRILDHGPAALPSLEQADALADPEVRQRAAQLADRLRVERNAALLAQLLADPSQPGPEGLPAWDRYSAIAGDGPNSRSLYAEMLWSEDRLLTLIDSNDEELPSVIQSRIDELYGELYLRRRSQGDSTPRSAVALLLLIAIECESTSNSALELILADLVDHSEIPVTAPETDDLASERDEPDHPLRRLLAAWVMTPHTAGAAERMHMGVKFSLPEAIEPARQILAAQRHTDAFQENNGVANPRSLDAFRQEAILVIARFGTPDNIPDLEPLLADETELRRRPSREAPIRTRIQDLALVGLLHLTEQKPEEYGFAPLQESGQYLYAAHSVGFETQEKRDAALRKWDHWQGLHLRSPLFGPLDAIEGFTL